MIFGVGGKMVQAVDIVFTYGEYSVQKSGMFLILCRWLFTSLLVLNQKCAIFLY